MRGIKTKWNLLLLCCSLWNTEAFAQPSTVTLTATQDSYIDSRLPTTPDGSSSNMSCQTYLNHGNYFYRRCFVEFDLSSIPSDGVIYSVTMLLTRTGAPVGTVNWNTKLITSSWTEGSVVASSQPTISALAGDLVTSSPSTISYTDTIHVENMVQRMVYGQMTNYGWSVQLYNESYAGASGAVFYTSEHGVSYERPRLVVQYYTPLSLASVSIIHESDTNTQDGSIAFTLDGGASSSYSYIWTEGSTGDTISTNDTLSGVSYGWYGLNITGSYGENYYQAFLVGRHCSVVTFNFESDENFVDNARIGSGTIAGVNYNITNYGNDVMICDDIWTTGLVYYQYRSLVRPRIWFDDEYTITEADITMYGSDHSTLGGSNASKFIQVTADWNENLVTWNAQPSTSTSITENIAATSSSTENKTVDILAFVEEWQTDNSANFGLSFQMQNTSNYKHKQVFHSPVATSASNRPDIEFTLDLLTGLEAFCNQPYIKLERKLTGLKYTSKYGKIYFAYDNEYASDSSNLSYSIFSVENRISPVISSGTSALSLVYGYNNIELRVSSLTTGEIYILEVTNDRGEKWFLRFEKD